MSRFIKEYIEEKKIPGLAVAVLSEGELVFQKGYGYRNVQEKLSVEVDTPFLVASISKTITAVANMILYEEDLFDLDDPINQYLPFEVIHPKFPDTEITIKMLHTHCSGLIDDHYWNIDPDVIYIRGNIDSPLSLQTLFEKLLLSDGEYYHKDTFSKSKPGTKYTYSNVGAALLGYLTECIAKKPFDEFCNERIFEPLNMKNTSWRIKDFDLDKLALPYYKPNQTKGHYGSPDYPNGLLRTSIEDLSKFMLMFVNDGTYNDVQILEEETVELMKEVHFEYEEDEEQNQVGLTWYYQNDDDDRALGHDGAEEGVTTSMFYYEEDEVGVILLCNLTDAEIGPIEDYIYDNLDEFESE